MSPTSQSSPPPPLVVERQGRIATLWLNRPEVHNAFNEALIEALTRELAVLDADVGVGQVILAGRGRSFCSGGDLDWMRRMSAFSPEENLRDAQALADMLHALATLSKPTVARVHGAALAGGMGLVAACDIAIASDEAVFGTTEVRLGLVPATISPYVIEAIGTRAARRYFLTGERLGAAEALRLGLVHQVCPAGELDGCVRSLTEALSLGAPGAQAASKQLIRAVAGQPLGQTLRDDTARRIASARAGEEAREGIAAFFARRPPDWQR